MYDDEPYGDYYDDELYDEWDEEDDYTDEDLSSEEYYEEDVYQHDPILSAEDMSPQVEWRQLLLGKERYEVSNTGKIRLYGKMWTLTEGLHKTGTPYRTYPIMMDDGTIYHKYVHEMVYEAFYGSPPVGWEVRHKNDEVVERIYSNDLENLEIYRML